MPTGRFKSVCPICTERELEVGSQEGDHCEAARRARPLSFAAP